MQDKLPKVFVNPVNKKIDNSQNIYYGLGDRKINTTNINSTIKRIFGIPNFLYLNVKIKTKDGIFNKTIIGKSNNKLITKENERIAIDDIIDIEVN